MDVPAFLVDHARVISVTTLHGRVNRQLQLLPHLLRAMAISTNLTGARVVAGLNARVLTAIMTRWCVSHFLLLRLLLLQ